MRILLATLLLIAVIPAYGSIIVFSNVTVVPPPPSVMAGQLTSDTTMYAFLESTDVLLTSAITSAITIPGTFVCCTTTLNGTIPAGITVDSYLLRYSPATAVTGEPGRELTAEISFSPGETIVGIIVGSTHIATTDSMFGAPGTSYPPQSYQLGGLETGDEVILANNMETVFVNFHVAPNQMDMIRILTQTPEPADFLLLGSGLFALALFGRRMQLKRAASR
jgi:hypothetical protein